VVNEWKTAELFGAFNRSDFAVLSAKWNMAHEICGRATRRIVVLGCRQLKPANPVRNHDGQREPSLTTSGTNATVFLAAGSV
jgi:hypothetical protein